MVEKYLPVLMLDENEPYRPVAFGWSTYKDGDKSESFDRRFQFRDDSITSVIEFAVYWDYDITHLYDLEHIWLYLDDYGHVVGAESSFHGTVVNGLLEGSLNLKGNQLKLYCQPGKHAMVPDPKVFESLSDYYTNCNESVGKDGLIITGVARGRYKTYPGLTDKIVRYMKKDAFVPGTEWCRYEFEQEKLMTWEAMDRMIPQRIALELEKIEESHTKMQ